MTEDPLGVTKRKVVMTVKTPKDSFTGMMLRLNFTTTCKTRIISLHCIMLGHSHIFYSQLPFLILFLVLLHLIHFRVPTNLLIV